MGFAFIKLRLVKYFYKKKQFQLILIRFPQCSLLIHPIENTKKKLLDQKGTLERNVLMPFYNGQMILIFAFVRLNLQFTCNRRI